MVHGKNALSRQIHVHAEDNLFVVRENEDPWIPSPPLQRETLVQRKQFCRMRRKLQLQFGTFPVRLRGENADSVPRFPILWIDQDQRSGYVLVRLVNNRRKLLTKPGAQAIGGGLRVAVHEGGRAYK